MPKIPCSSLAVNLSWSAKAVQGDAVSASDEQGIFGIQGIDTRRQLSEQ